LSDVIEELGPLFDIITQHFVDLSTLEVPKRLVLSPDTKVLFSMFENFFELHVGLFDVVLLHVLDKVEISSRIFGLVAKSLGFNLLN
jgi:hypothetical protein